MKNELPPWLQGLPPEGRDVIPRLYEEIVSHRLVRDHLARELVRLVAALARVSPQDHHDLVRSNLQRARQLLAGMPELDHETMASVLAGLCFVIDDACADPEFEDAERARHDAHVLGVLEMTVLRACA